MRKGHYRWNDSQIHLWAQIYLNTTPSSMQRMERLLGVSHSTVWWCFKNRLQYIDRGLYEAVLLKLASNKSMR